MQPRLIKISALRTGAADALALGSTFPFSNRRIVEEQIVVDAQVAFAGFRLGFGEQNDQFVVQITPINGCLVNQVAFVLFFLFDEQIFARAFIIGAYFETQFVVPGLKTNDDSNCVMQIVVE